MRKTGLLLFLLIGFHTVFGQNPIGLPNIISYSRSDYNGGLQNRGIVQDDNGILYFANSEGLLCFDGTYWKLYPLPNKTIVRSVAIGRDHNIYVGGQNEMGYFSPNRSGNLVFTSLKALLPQNKKSFKDVWDIVPWDGKLFLRSPSEIFQYDYHSITIYQPAMQWQFLTACNGRLLAEDAQSGMMQFTGGKWQPLLHNDPLNRNLLASAILSLNKDSILVATQSRGLFILADKKLSSFKFEEANPFANQLILCAMVMDDHTIAIGTHMGGLYIMDKHGQIIQHITRREGLQNNTILGLFLDRDRNLWMGLDDGIDFDASNSAIKHIYPEKLNEGAGYSAMLFKNMLYIGTSNWLYALPVKPTRDLSTVDGDFKPIANTKGSAWGLFSFDNNLLLAHHEGAFQIEGEEARPINTHFGYWNFNLSDDVFPPSTLLAGNYNGLDRINYSKGKFTSEGNISFGESSRYVIAQGKTIWVAHNYKGIFKIDLSSPSHPHIKLYTGRNGLPSTLKNRLFKIRNRMVVATEKGVYEYNPGKDLFEPSAYFKNTFGQRDLRYLREDARGNVWFIEEKKLGVADFSGRTPQLIYFPELNGKLVSDFENIYPLNEENIFVGAEKGFYHINYTQYKRNKNVVGVLVRSVRAYGNTDSILYGGYSLPGSKKQLYQPSIKQNSLHFEFSTPSFQKQGNMEYSTLLSGFDPGWSAWSKRTEKDYTNLPEGRYTFKIKARTNLGDESAIAAYSFVVLPPWYRTAWAYSFYGILFLAFNYTFYRWLKWKFIREELRHEEEQKRLKYLHQLEMEKSEKEIIALKNEKLESEILGKNSELASVAMHLLQKGELLAKIKEELVHLRKASDDMPSEELHKLIRILNQESKMDKDWEQFAVYFDHTHSDFLKAVKEVHPLLSPHELKLCAYLRMNLSSKEMAQLLNISVRGVEISRYRLRKKLALAKETNLHNYFTAFSAAKHKVV